jgi:hypothetical protein
MWEIKNQELTAKDAKKSAKDAKKEKDETLDDEKLWIIRNIFI